MALASCQVPGRHSLWSHKPITVMTSFKSCSLPMRRYNDDAEEQQQNEEEDNNNEREQDDEEMIVAVRSSRVLAY